MSSVGSDVTEPIRITQRPHPVRTVGNVLLGVAVLVAVAAAVAIAVVPAATGSYSLTVLSGSMEPALPVGSVVVARPVPVETIEVGDVVTFTDRDTESTATRVVTHRVVNVEQGRDGPTFGTRGDANNTDDVGRTDAPDIIGVQWYTVPWAGGIREGLTTPVGLFYSAGILLLLVAAHLLLPDTQTVKPRGRRR